MVRERKKTFLKSCFVIDELFVPLEVVIVEIPLRSKLRRLSSNTGLYDHKNDRKTHTDDCNAKNRNIEVRTKGKTQDKEHCSLLINNHGRKQRDAESRNKATRNNQAITDKLRNSLEYGIHNRRTEIECQRTNDETGKRFNHEATNKMHALHSGKISLFYAVVSLVDKNRKHNQRQGIVHDEIQRCCLGQSDCC